MSFEDVNYHDRVSDLLRQELTALEYFNTIPENIRKKAKREDIGSYADLQSFFLHQKDLR